MIFRNEMRVWDRDAVLVEENVDSLITMMTCLRGSPSRSGRYYLYSLEFGVNEKGKVYTLPESAWTYKYIFRLKYNGRNLEVYRGSLVDTRNTNLQISSYAEQIVYVSLNILTQEFSRFQKYIDLKAS